MQDGLVRLRQWLCDLARSGVAAVEARPLADFETRAARLVDAQAPRLANAVRDLALIPGSSDDWPDRFVDAVGSLALLVEAGLRKADVLAGGERLVDEWLVLGQEVEDGEQYDTRRTWLRGRRHGRSALILEFAPGASFPERLDPGTAVSAELAWYPASDRALLVQRLGEPTPITDPVPGEATLDALLDRAADAIARDPWARVVHTVLRDVIPTVEGDRWRVLDRTGAALPLTGEPWSLLALGGGRPLHLAATWNGRRLHPRGALADGRWVTL